MLHPIRAGMLVLCGSVGLAQTAPPSLADCTGTPDWEAPDFDHWECIKKNWTSFPDPTLFNATTNLQLTGNHITSLPASLAAGGGLVSLKSLYLEDNELTEIVGSAFDGLDVLNLLFITGNKLKGTLHRDVFSFMTGLHTLYLYNNKIDAVEAGAFAKNTKLFSLSLFNNPVQTFPAHLFDSCRDLTFLDLHSTKLFSLPKALLYNVTGFIGGEITFGSSGSSKDSQFTPLYCKDTPISGPNGLYFTECKCSPPDASTPLVLVDDSENICCVPAGQVGCFDGLDTTTPPSPLSPSATSAPPLSTTPMPPGPGKKSGAGAIVGAMIGVCVLGAAGYLARKRYGGNSATRAAAYAVMNNDEDDDIFSGNM